MNPYEEARAYGERMYPKKGDRIISEPFPLILSTNQLSRLSALSFEKLRDIGFSESEINQIYKLNKDINDQH